MFSANSGDSNPTGEQKQQLTSPQRTFQPRTPTIKPQQPTTTTEPTAPPLDVQPIFNKHANENGQLTKTGLAAVLTELYGTVDNNDYLNQQVDAIFSLSGVTEGALTYEQFITQYQSVKGKHHSTSPFDADISFGQTISLKKDRTTDEIKDDSNVSLVQ